MEGIASKIAALLAKAESTEFAAEAEALIDKATDLAEKHAINLAWVAASGGGQDTVERVFITLETSAWLGFKEMASLIGYAYGFQCVWHPKNRSHPKPRVAWVGWKSDLNVAEQVYASLLIQCARAQANHLGSPEIRERIKYASQLDGKKPGWHRFVEGRSFIMGFGRATAARIAEARRLAQRKFEDDRPGTGLVLANRQDLIQDEIGRFYPNLSAGRRSRTAQSGSGLVGGGAAGRNADTGGARVGNRKAIGR